MTKDLIQSELARCFLPRKWKLECVARLPDAFVRSTVVTPFFQPRVLRRSESRYLIDGYVGVVHREFERDWVASKKLKVNTQCVARNIANFDSLRARQEIHSHHIEPQLSSFCPLVMDILEAFPHSEEELSAAFRQDMLGNLPLESFAILAGETAKFRALKSFVLDRSAVSSR